MHALLASLVLAFSLAAAPAQTPSTQKLPEKKPKKVWTNDDIDRLHGTTGGVAASGTLPAGSAPAEEKPAEKDKPLAGEKDPKAYIKKLTPLRAQLDAIDAQIKQTRDGLLNPFKGSNAVGLANQGAIKRPEDLLQQLQQKRQQLQQKISDLEDEARRNGIAPGDIR